MTDKHNYSFFGQRTGLTVQSPSKSEPYIFFRLIKKKDGGTWEKPSKGEGKTIKLSLEEMVMIIQVLKKESNSWSSYHSFKGNKTQISFKWQNGKENILWINIGDYPKMLNFQQTEILKLLLEHLLKEKIKFATASNSFKKATTAQNNIKIQDSIENVQNQNYNALEKTIIVEEKENISPISSNKSKIQDRTNLEGLIKGQTEKALLIKFANGLELWIPKSVIHSKYNGTNNMPQGFLIDNWILKKNNLIA